ncbi:MAG TPA: glycosyltransferase [Acidimicrobiia bacterium]|nr:glycosyltransferase [Acidimicrobiia bacterium]
MRLSVVMPAHNEATLLDTSVREVVDGLRDRDESFQVLVVENGSQDGTGRLAEALAADLPEVSVRTLPRADYGRALRTGLLAATGHTVVNFDVDCTDLGFLDAALGRFEQPDPPAIIVGSKRAPGAHDQRSWARRFVTWVFGLVLRVGFGLRVTDTHGMKALDRARVLPIAEACRSDGELFDTELILRAERARLAVTELPVTVAERRPARTSIARRALRTLAGLARLRLALARDRRAAA